MKKTMLVAALALFGVLSVSGATKPTSALYAKPKADAIRFDGYPMPVPKPGKPPFVCTWQEALLCVLEPFVCTCINTV